MISDLSSDILEKCIVCLLKLKDNVEKKEIREKRIKEEQKMNKSKVITICTATMLTLGMSMSAAANGLEDFNDYMNADGTYSYFFDQGIFVTMSEEWYQNTFVKAELGQATFYHKDSYEKYQESGIEDGGELFTIAYSVNTSFKDLEEMTYIGFDEEEMLNYYATKPTDYPAYVSDPAVKAEYDSLWSEVDDVIENIEILSVQTTDIEESAAETTDTAIMEGGRTPSSDLYAIAGNDQFSFECVKDWHAYRQGSAVVVQKTEESDVPYYSISPITLEGTPGEEIVTTMNHFRDSYKERIAKEPEMLTYEVEGTDRKIAGVSINVSSEDGMDTVTNLILIEELDGSYYEYRCGYVSQTYAEDSYEDETTYFEFMHAIETMECK